MCGWDYGLNFNLHRRGRSLACPISVMRLFCFILIVGSALAATHPPALPSKYDHWLKEEVVYIIDDEEKKEFLKLDSDSAREAFIKEFWDIRNPVRGSEYNAFKEEHYRRIQYANENFGHMSNTPGWRTDMGHTFILFGKPQSRVPFKGYSQLYPVELWFYSNETNNPALPPFFHILFFIPEDIGEYRFYRPGLDGPLKLVRGSQFRTNRDVYQFLKPKGGDLAHAAFSLIPSEPLDTMDFSITMTSDVLLAKIQDLANDQFQVKRIRELRYLKTKVNSWFLIPQQQPLEITSIALADPNGQHWLDYGVLIDNQNLGHRNGAQLAVHATFRVLTQKGDVISESTEDRAYPAFENAEANSTLKPFLLATRVPINPGKYKLETEVVNREAGRSYKGERLIMVGEEPGKVSLLGPLMAGSAQKAANPDTRTAFQYFGVQFVPMANRPFSPRDPLRMLFEVRAPTGDNKNYKLEYMLAHNSNRQMRRNLTEVVQGSNFNNGTLLKSKTVPLTDLEPGDYRLVITLRGEGSGEALASATVPFRIGEQMPTPAVYFVAQKR
jgi:GWxTD domain-containing protein